MALVQIDARRDGFDRRQFDVVVGVHQFLIGGRHRRAAAAMLGEDVARHVGFFAQRTGHARMALAALLLRCPFGDVGLLAARRRQRGIVRRLRRLAELGFEFRNASEELGVLREQFVEPTKQRSVLRHDPKHHRLQVVIERIECLGWHPELESAPRAAHNAAELSHTAAQG